MTSVEKVKFLKKNTEAETTFSLGFCSLGAQKIRLEEYFQETKNRYWQPDRKGATGHNSADSGNCPRLWLV